LTTRSKRQTYRITPEVDRWLSEESKRLGVSKNDIVMLTLAKVMNEEKAG